MHLNLFEGLDLFLHYQAPRHILDIINPASTLPSTFIPASIIVQSLGPQTTSILNLSFSLSKNLQVG